MGIKTNINTNSINILHILPLVIHLKLVDKTGQDFITLGPLPKEYMNINYNTDITQT